MGKTYKGIHLTNHALERMQQRGVTDAQVWTTLNSPHRSRYAKEKQKFIYNRSFGQDMVEVVASQNEKKEWVVVSVWSRPEWQMKHNQYYARVGVIDKLLDGIAGFFSRNKGKK